MIILNDPFEQFRVDVTQTPEYEVLTEVYSGIFAPHWLLEILELDEGRSYQVDLSRIVGDYVGGAREKFETEPVLRWHIVAAENWMRTPSQLARQFLSSFTENMQLAWSH